MPSKKKKYNARFPPARIKKIMQTDEDVGKVAAAVPVIISRSLELFIESFIQKTAAITKGRNAKTLSAAHIKQTIHSEKTFDFLRDLVANVPDHQPEEDGDSLSSAPSSSTAPEVKKPKVQRPKKEKTGNGRGRPRKKDVVKEEIPEKEEKEETESEDDDEDDEEGSDTDSSQTNTEQSQPGAETSQTHPLIMQTPLQSGSHDAETTVSSDMQTNPAFDSASGSASVMAPSFPQHNPMSPRLSQLQSPSQFPNMGMMPLPQIQNIPHPQFQTGPNQMLPSQHQYSGLTNQIPPPPSLTNFSNQLPVQQNFYPAHMSQIHQYPIVNSQETFHSDQKPSFMMPRETPPFSSSVSQFSPQVNQKELNPGNSYLNNVQNNEPLDMSKSSHSQRSPATNHESVPGKSKGMPFSFAGLTNIMNMTVPKPVTDDDDYDT